MIWILLAQTVGAQAWRTGSVCSIDEENLDISCHLQLDMTDSPHIVFCHADGLSYARFAPLGWKTKLLANLPGMATSVSFVIDTSGHLHVSYSDVDCENLRYACKRDTVWYFEIVDTLGCIGDHAAIAVDLSGNPHIAYHNVLCGFLKYASRDDSSWHVDVVDRSESVGWYPSIAIDLKGIPHIAYHDYEQRDLKYARRHGGQWHIEIVDSVGVVGEYASIAVDTLGRPHISYNDGSNDCLKYVFKQNGVWHSETVGLLGEHSSLCLDGGGYPHISSSGAEIRYAWRDAEGWHRESLAHDTWEGGNSTSLALDSTGRPFITFFDGLAGSLVFATFNCRADRPAGNHIANGASIWSLSEVTVPATPVHGDAMSSVR
jgi:hypothetical protein